MFDFDTLSLITKQIRYHLLFPKAAERIYFQKAAVLEKNILIKREELNYSDNIIIIMEVMKIF